jgi:outer membrane protein TolC
MLSPLRNTLFILLLMLISLAGNCQERTLEYYLTTGAANSPVLKDLSNQIQANQYDSLIARASYLPQVNFNAYLMYAPVVNGWGYSDVITNGQNLTGTLNVNQQIFNKKTREANFQKYGLETRNLDNTRKITVNELKKAITAQYLAAYSALLERKFQQQVLSALYDEEKILKIWVEKGTYRQTDYLSLKVEMMNLERNTRDLDLQYRKEFWNLNMICGISDTTLFDLSLPSMDESMKNIPENSPLFLRFLIDSLRLQNEKLMIDRKYKPSVSWFSDGGIVNNEPQYLYQNFGISFGLSMTLPVYDGNQRKLNYGKIRAQEETRKYYQDYFSFQYNSRLKQLQSELAKIRELGKENEKQIVLAGELVDQDKALLNIGSLSITDYILGLKNLIEAKHNGILYQIRAQFILNEINFWKQ